MLFATYAIGVPFFAFLTWVFSDAVHIEQHDSPHLRRMLSAVSGLVWPLMAIGVAQILGVWMLAKLGRSSAFGDAGPALVPEM